MEPKSLPLQALVNAAAGSLYILLIAWSMFNVVQLIPKEDTFLAPATFLLLFVLSAAIEGTLVLGQPIMLYLDGKKTEGLKLLAMTLGWFFIILALIVAIQVMS